MSQQDDLSAPASDQEAEAPTAASQGDLRPHAGSLQGVLNNLEAVLQRLEGQHPQVDFGELRGVQGDFHQILGDVEGVDLPASPANQPPLSSPSNLGTVPAGAQPDATFVNPNVSVPQIPQPEGPLEEVTAATERGNAANQAIEAQAAETQAAQQQAAQDVAAQQQPQAAEVPETAEEEADGQYEPSEGPGEAHEVQEDPLTGEKTEQSPAPASEAPSVEGVTIEGNLSGTLHEEPKPAEEPAATPVEEAPPNA